jgi:hypothetical protein
MMVRIRNRVYACLPSGGLRSKLLTEGNIGRFVTQNAKVEFVCLVLINALSVEAVDESNAHDMRKSKVCGISIFPRTLWLLLVINLRLGKGHERSGRGG